MKRARILAVLLTGVFVIAAVSPAHAADDDWQSLTLPDWGADPEIGAGDHVYELVSGTAVGLQCGGHMERYEDSGIVTGPCNWAMPAGNDPVTSGLGDVVHLPLAILSAGESLPMDTAIVLTADRSQHALIGPAQGIAHWLLLRSLLQERREAARIGIVGKQ